MGTVHRYKQHPSQNGVVHITVRRVRDKETEKGPKKAFAEGAASCSMDRPFVPEPRKDYQLVEEPGCGPQVREGKRHPHRLIDRCRPSGKKGGMVFDPENKASSRSTLDDPERCASPRSSRVISGATDSRCSPPSSAVTADASQICPETMASSQPGEKRDEMDDTPLWDRYFRMTPWESSKKRCMNMSIIPRMVKVLTYCFMFVFVIAAGVTSRVSLFIMTSFIKQQHQATKQRDVTVYLLLATMCIPDALLFVSSILKCLFGKKSRPTLRGLLFVLVRETVHAVGLCLLLFKVLPRTDFLLGSFLLTSAAIVPTIFHVLMTSASSKKRFAAKIVIGLAAVLAQLSAIPIMFFKLEANTAAVNETTVGSSTEPSKDAEESQKKHLFPVYAIVSVLMLSLRWWETYAVRDIKVFGLTVPFKAFALELYRQRSKSYIFAAVWKVAVTVGMTFLFIENLAPPSMDLVRKATNETSKLDGDPLTIQINWDNIVFFFIHLAATWMSHHLATLSCKLQMQRLGFALSLNLVTPVFFTGLVVLCKLTKWTSLTAFSQIELECPVESVSDIPFLVVFACIFLGQLWTTSHAWVPTNDRLAFTDRLFVLPNFFSPLVEQSLLYSRRKDDQFDHDCGRSDQTDQKEEPGTKIYVCATMWHENETEMIEMLKSVFRLDKDQSARRTAQEVMKITDPDYYEFEVHIFFDDAIDRRAEDGKKLPNQFVTQLVTVIEKAASVIHEFEVKIADPVKIQTPYGGRLMWTLPGENIMVAHLKDKSKIRHRKRWSQVMYMYYLLGYRMVDKELRSTSGLFPAKLPPNILAQAERTFLLALDGDVDFKPEAVQLLVDRMKKNKKVGAACGRIKPRGAGPVVWYQRFEYAIGHWLQKSAEHMYGCVLCSPGCFSLFRGKALMDDSVMKTYTTKPTEARHYIQYDQGEDRWLCTLLLQQGYRVEYCAVSDALTFAPEGFKEFFNQRRRWVPSTIANIIDLLQSYSHTIKANDNISYPYIIYQLVLLASSILGPATILLMIQSSVASVFHFSDLLSYLLSFGPTILFIFVCYRYKANTQLTLAAALSAIFALVMMAVIAGTLLNIVEEGWYTPNAIFMFLLVGSFVFAGTVHPQEFSDLLWGALYFVCIPAGYLFLMIYSVCNLHVVSWGTREVAKPAQKEDSQTPENKPTTLEIMKKQVMAEDGKNSCPAIRNLLCCEKKSKVSDMLMVHVLESISRFEARMFEERGNDPASVQVVSEADPRGSENPQTDLEAPPTDIQPAGEEWIHDSSLGNGTVETLEDAEEEFWKTFIDKYLLPMDKDKSHEEKVAAELKSLRNRTSFAFFMLNALWVVTMVSLQKVKGHLNINIPRVDQPPLMLEPLGFAFLIIFAVLLSLQFIAMIMHRYGTLLHILATTEIFRFRGTAKPEDKVKAVIRFADMLQQLKENKEDMRLLEYSQDRDTETLFVNGNVPNMSPIRQVSDGCGNRRRVQDSYQQRYGRGLRRVTGEQTVTPTLRETFNMRFDTILRNMRTSTPSRASLNDFIDRFDQMGS